MQFFFPDSQDQVDPSFDFITEQRAIYRVRQRDDQYAHEVLDPPPYDGLLVSKPVVDGLPSGTGKYTEAQRNRLYREGARHFFRLEQDRSLLSIMGDCGAFTYVREAEPVYNVEEVLEFYDACGFDIGISMDHLIFGYDADLDARPASEVPEDWRFRQNLTIQLAAEFLRLHRVRSCAFEPVAVAHGWSPKSYAASVRELQSVGYKRIALGGMVPLKTQGILDSLRVVRDELESGTRLHLLGVTRTEHIPEFARLGVTSIDSTAPFRRAFKDDKDNYYTMDGSHVALRVPQVDGNTKLRTRVTAGMVDQRDARRLEKACLDQLRRFDRDETEVSNVLDAICSYGKLIGDDRDRSQQYAETLEARPWKHCGCTICKKIGIEVVLFRGAERNRRRGFHNLAVFCQRLGRELGAESRSQNETCHV